MATAEIKIRSSFSPNGFDQARNNVSKLDKQVKEATHNINAGFQNIKTGNVVSGISQITNGIKQFVLSHPAVLAVAGGFALLAKSVSDCVKEFVQSEQVQVRFEQSMKSLNLSLYTQHFNNLASSIQKTTGISDEVVKDVIQIGLQMGISVKDMEKTVKVAADLSATFGIDLKNAVEMLAKAQEGETTQLTRMLPNLKETIKNAKDYSEILGVVGEKVQGAAEAQGNTLFGSMQKLKESFSDLKENIGSTIAPALQNIVNFVTTIVEKINELFTKSKAGIGKVSVGGQLVDYSQAEKMIKGSTSNKVVLEGQVFEKNTALELLKLMKDWGLTIEEAIIAQQQLKIGMVSVTEIVEKLFSKRNEKTESGKEKDDKEKDDKEKDDTTNTEENTEKLTNFVITGFTDIFTTMQNILTPITFDFSQFQTSLQNVVEVINDRFKTTERDVTNFGTKLRENIRNFLGNTFGVDLSSVKGFLLSILQQTQTFQALKNVLNPIIKMLDVAFRPILQAIAPILQVIYQILAPILQLIIPPLILFATMIANIIQALKALATTIYFIVTLQWNRLGEVKWTAFTGEQISQMIQDAQSGIASAATENPFADVTNTSTTSYSASGARDIYVNIYFNNSYVNGDAREIALRLRDEIRLAESMGY